MSTRKKVLVGIGTLLLVLVVFFAIRITQIVGEVRRVLAVPLGEYDLAGLADGEYTGKERYLGDDFEVKVTLLDHRIDKIEILKADERKYTKMASAVTARVVEKQSLDVDAVSGATVTSKVFRNAISNALSKAPKETTAAPSPEPTEPE